MIGAVRVGEASNPGPRQACGPGMGEVTLSKRGPRAWENYHSQPLLPLAKGGTTRLLVHAIGDATAVQWLPRVRDFLISCKRQGMKLEGPESVDAAIAQHLDWMCYSQRLLPSHGSLLMFGMLCIMPELNGHLCLTSRSLKSWQKLAVTVEGGPMAEEAVFMVVHFFFRSGAYYEGAWTLLQYDVYAREQDMESLRENDIDFDGRVVSLHFGVSTRGESVKTGTNQGATIRRGPVADIILALKANTPKGALIFPISQGDFRKAWHTACASLGISYAGPPHVLRHSGPSEDIARGRTSLEGVRRRGRWKALTSVQRYTKTFALTKFRSRMPQKLLQRGQEAVQDLRSVLLSSLRSSRGGNSTLNNAFIGALIGARVQDALLDDSHQELALRSLGTPAPTTSRSSKASTSASRSRPASSHGDDYDSSCDGGNGWCTE